MLVLYPPILPGTTRPVSRGRRTHTIALLTETPKRAAAARAEIPSRKTAKTSRSRKSVDMGLDMICWPPIPAQSLMMWTPLHRSAAAMLRVGHPNRKRSVHDEDCDDRTGSGEERFPGARRR